MELLAPTTSPFDGTAAGRTTSLVAESPTAAVEFGFDLDGRSVYRTSTFRKVFRGRRTVGDGRG